MYDIIDAFTPEVVVGLILLKKEDFKKL